MKNLLSGRKYNESQPSRPSARRREKQAEISCAVSGEGGQDSDKARCSHDVRCIERPAQLGRCVQDRDHSIGSARSHSQASSAIVDWSVECGPAESGQDPCTSAAPLRRQNLTSVWQMPCCHCQTPYTDCVSVKTSSEVRHEAQPKHREHLATPHTTQPTSRRARGRRCLLISQPPLAAPAPCPSHKADVQHPVHKHCRLRR